MTVTGAIQILALVGLLTALTPLVGGHMARVYQGDRVALTALLAPVERIVYRLFRVDRSEEQGWKEYVRALLLWLSSPFGGELAVGERDVDAGAAEVDHRDQGVGGVEAVCAV